MGRRTISLALSFIFILAMLAGCDSKKSNEDSSIVRVGFFANFTHSQALIGKNRGDYQKALGSDITIDWKQFNAGSSEIEAFLAGELDLGFIGPGPAINGFTKSKGDVVIIAGSTDAGAILVSKKNSDIKTVKDLDGKRIAIPQYGNTQDLCLRYLLRENGLMETTKGGTVDVVQATNADIKTLLDKGDIDGALVPEPWGARLQKEVGANLVLDYNDIWRNGEYPTTVVIARKEFLEKHPDVVENFLKAHVELTSYVNNNKKEAASLVNGEIKNLTKKALDEDVLEKAFSRITVTNDPNPEIMDEMIDLSLKVSFIKEEYKGSNLFELDILNKVLLKGDAR
ncbi:aliphatic sulfonate ABC transporter substrate-binding protein [Clostridium sp. UBA1652]|uniref:aliphatic sulfonate ABC transporter substrate-binding protein n=1 Tax=Clostridium sp. UBA1652 TaxID=1946348 RepID=UPI00257DC706|nr:aliphatic sulfonate ABC transporter substrate-binding protein [Clostridium sp. UBA1652]